MNTGVAKNEKTSGGALDPRIVSQCKRNLLDIKGLHRTQFVSATRGEFVCRGVPGSDCGNNMGNVHGGFLLTLADQAATCAAETHGHDNVTMTVSANFLRPARVDDAYIEVRARTVHAGRRSIVVQVEEYRPSGELVLQATYTQAAFDTLVVDRAWV